jgi:predicted phage terminase large subunit-like protein
MIESGKVYLREGAPWVADFLDECSQFPRGGHDDQVDAMVYALSYLRSSSISIDITKGADSIASKGDW